LWKYLTSSKLDYFILNCKLENRLFLPMWTCTPIFAFCSF